MRVATGRRAASSLALLAVGVLALGGLAACGSSDDGSSSATTTTLAPESVFAPDAEVTAGLGELRTTFQAAHDAIVAKSATVGSYPDDLEAQWFAIEGTIKKNSPANYISMEDALARMMNAANRGSATEAQKAVETFNTAADAYLAAHP